jgi:hypothetical protein
MSTPQVRFLRSLIALLRLSFPGAERGRKHGSRYEPLINGTPFFIEADCDAQWPEMHDVIASSEERYSNDERPRLVFFKQPRQEPLAVMRVTDFVAFMDKHLWRPDAE